MHCLSPNLTCLNGGYCQGNSCICPDECFFGDRCENYFNVLQLSLTDAILQEKHIAKIIYIIVFVFIGTIGLLNNILALVTCVRERIRITVCGTYLVIYFSCNIILMLLIFTEIISLVDYSNANFRKWDCFAIPYLCLTFDYIYIWMGVAIIIEKALIECLNIDIFGSRIRPLIISFIIVVVVALSNIPEIKLRQLSHDLTNQLVCNYNIKKDHNWYNAHRIIAYFHITVPCGLHFICIAIILITIARRKIFIRGYYGNFHSIELCRVSCQQLWLNRDLLISPLIIIVCIVPHAVVHFILLPQCLKDDGITKERIHIIFLLLLHVPAMFAFFIYVLPNRSYFEEFKHTSIFRKFHCCVCHFKEKTRLRLAHL